jgi:hypothetical protein
MSASASAFLRLVGPAAAAATLALGSLPAFAQSATSSSSGNCSHVRFELANPSPGAMLEPGGLVLEGIAVDSRAPQSQAPGIDRIDFFLGNRDQGGMSIGTAVPGLTSGPFGAGSFQTTVQVPNLMGGHDLFAYAHSSVTGQEVILSEPIAVGESPAVAGETSANGSTPTVSESCTPANGATPSPAVVTPGTTVTTPSTTTPTTATPSATVVLNVFNPDPGATVLSGAYIMQGAAWDTAAQSGIGVDRVDVFLDDRDLGGLHLGTAMLGESNPAVQSGSQFSTAGWTLMADFPSNQKGLHALFFYVHSTVSGGETIKEIPITIQ